MTERFARVASAFSRACPDGQTAILGPNGDEVIVLNEMGGIVWMLCDGTRTCSEIAAFIHQYTRGAERAQIEKDVRELLSSLRDKNLLVNCLAGPP